MNGVEQYRHVAIVVLAWNRCDLTLECLASLSELDYPQERLQIIVVDNGSQDETVVSVREEYPQVTVIANEVNLGFAEGNNVGIRYALDGQAEYIMLLNNDTVVHREMLTELLSVMESDPEVGIVGPKMLYFDRPHFIWSAGNQINWWLGTSARLLAEEADSDESQLPSAVDFVTACGIMVRREVAENLGLMDTRFFLYYEETDWCVRAKRAGWRILYVPSARLWHRVSASLGAESPAVDYYMNRNVLLFLARQRRGPLKIVSLLLAVSRNLITIAAYTARPHGGRRIPNRNARLLALRDAAVGRWGEMGADVMAVCFSYP